MKSDLFHAVDSVASLTTCSLLLHVAQTFEGLHAAILVLHCLVVPNRFHPSSEATTQTSFFHTSLSDVAVTACCNDSPSQSVCCPGPLALLPGVVPSTISFRGSAVLFYHHCRLVEDRRAAPSHLATSVDHSVDRGSQHHRYDVTHQ